MKVVTTQGVGGGEGQRTSFFAGFNFKKKKDTTHRRKENNKTKENDKGKKKKERSPIYNI